jgi:hypothetical protein
MQRMIPPFVCSSDFLYHPKYLCVRIYLFLSRLWQRKRIWALDSKNFLERMGFVATEEETVLESSRELHGRKVTKVAFLKLAQYKSTASLLRGLRFA